MGQKSRERRQGYRPGDCRVECASPDGTRLAGRGIGPAYFKIGPLHRHSVWKLKRWLSQLCRPEAVA